MKNFFKNMLSNIKAGLRLLWEKIKALFARIGAKFKRAFQRLRAKITGKKEQE
ncbi:MAG: hypothetical protein KA099_03105 [Alphaproteobacteria bacterium]|nr:hypothetical protein [Alphaproteobacteria bacterium]MBP7759331.1 hypothetical protein [Alphaproteobacteria bacterium]MBP7762544.1 hypothetical protein [Alphaproteobacteria bacterium]MBP7904291.1 hypothetical protein [Alphaproteobacteria bacterium]